MYVCVCGVCVWGGGGMYIIVNICWADTVYLPSQYVCLFVFRFPADSAGVDEVAKFLVDNHHLSKAMIGDYLGDRRNTEVLTAFIR